MINRFIKSDIALKLLSVLIAIGVWIYVIQFQNPEIEKYMNNIPIVFSQLDVLQQKGLCILGDKKQTLQIKLYGKRKILSYINSTNITSLVDVSLYNAPGTYQAPIALVFPVDGVEVVEKKPYNYVLEVDRIANKEFDIVVDVKGTPKDSFVIGEPVLSSKKVEIRGPKSIIDTVVNARVPIDVGGKDKEVTAQERIRLYDTNNKEIINSQLELSLTEVTVACPIIRTKALKITPVITDAFRLPEGKFLKIEMITPSEVKVFGDDATLLNLKNIKTKVINPEFRDNIYQTDVDLVFDAGVNSADSIKTVKVKLVLADRADKNIVAHGFKLDNLNAKYKCTVLTKELAITVSGDKDSLDKMTEDDLGAVINLNGLKPGTHKVLVEFANGITVVGQYYVDVLLAE